MRYVFSVRTVRPDDVGAVEIVFLSESQARTYATDQRVLATSVTRFTVARLGTRHPLAWFVRGTEQDPRSNRPGGYYPADGHPAHG